MVEWGMVEWVLSIVAVRCDEGTSVVDGARSSDGTELEAEDTRVWERLKRLEEAIGELEGAQRLRPDAAARLAKYRESHERMQFARRSLDWRLQESQPLDAERPTPPMTDKMPKREKQKKEERRVAAAVRSLGTNSIEPPSSS